MSRPLKITVFTLLVLVAVLVSVPWWLGLALRPILRSKSITFERYERVGYAHFRLHGVAYQRARVTVTAGQVSTVTPLIWLGQRLRDGPTVTADNWLVQVTPLREDPTADTAAKPMAGAPDLQAVLQRVGQGLVRWLPHAHLHSGVVQVRGRSVAIDDVDWHQGTLNLKGVHAAGRVFAATVAPGANDTLVISAHAAGDDAQLHLVWSGSELKGDASLWGQPVLLSARFPADGWLPAEASASASNWSLPAARVKLGAPYVTVKGDAKLEWRNRAFDLSLNATAEPAPDTKAPPFIARAQAHGTRRAVTLTALDLNAPFATAQLTAPVTFSLNHPLAGESAELLVAADLSKFPWIEGARGEVKGTVTVKGDTAAARQEFALEFSEVALPGFTLKKAQASGALHWPLLELKTLAVQLDDTSRIEAHGTIDWQKRAITGAALQANLSAASVSRWLPAGLTWEAAEITATLEGPLDAPRHQGSVKVTQLQRSPLKPVALDASWQGTGGKADTLSARVTAGPSTVELTGALDRQGLQLEKFQFAAAGQTIWQLAAPARLAWSPILQCDPLQLTGPDSQVTLEVKGGPAHEFAVTATRFDSAWLQDWVTLAGPTWQLHALQTNGRIVDGVLVFDTTLTAGIAMPPQSAQVKLSASGDAQGVQLKELTVTAADRVLTQATGRLPVSWQLRPKSHLQIDPAAPLELAASTDPASPLWATLAAATGLELTRPDAKINLTGTLSQPAGDLQLQVARLAFKADKSSYALPEAKDLALAVHFARTEITLTNFSAQLEGQAVSASGRVPMDDDAWRQLWQHPGAVDWSKAEGKLEIPDADLAPFARHAPNFVFALGRLHARVEVAHGKFSGELRLKDVFSRPLPPFGTLQELNGDLVLADRTLTVRSLSARLGGEPVTLEGSVTLPSGGPPHLNLGLKGTRLPLVRSTELLVRSDLDLHATTNDAGVTRITGTVRLRDSLALAGFNQLLPGGPRGVTRVPPYFSVKAEPFNRWPLDVQVSGAEAVKIRTTVFNGTVSARFHLTGTLGDPRAVGDLTVDQGQVLFPFAVFRVQQGTVRLSEADSFHARINLIATSQRRDYQLRLEVTGQLPNPVITMSSSPALEATDVLLMVMTGRPPTGETSTSSAQRLALLGAYLGRELFADFGSGDGENRLEISSGEQITKQGRETYEFEYKLSDRWSLVGEYDQFDSYNADLKRRIFIQESTPRDEKK